jgi:anti-sigma factor RsiW
MAELACEDVVELVTDYLEGALSPEEVALFENHISDCEGCERYLEQMRTTIAAVGRLGEADVPPAMRERLLAAFRDRRRG